MANMNPIVKAEMLIRRPASEVYEAFVDPEITSQFWFTGGSGRLEQGKSIRWEWAMYGVSDEIVVKDLQPNKRIRIESSDGTETEWTFEAAANDETFVTITNSGFPGDVDAVVAYAIDSMGGYTMVLCGCKALLEHNIRLNLVADKAPYAHVLKS